LIKKRCIGCGFKALLTLANFTRLIKPANRVEVADNYLNITGDHVTPETVMGKLKGVDEIAAIAAAASKNGKTVVFTNGCFDILHRGHVHVLRQAKAEGDILIVGLNSDKSVKSIKGNSRPILPEIDRVELISAMEMVDYVVIFDEPDPYHLILAIRPAVLAKGGDWSGDKIVGADIVKESGGRVAVIPYLKGFSTSEIIERIRN
jgi:D-beta-D-heptose 7-phosphate kinase/D-beta-D-heptose 1-phosphate adenosyltransferase